MPKRLDDLYHSFCKKQEFTDCMLSVEENYKVLADHLSEPDRKAVLRIMDSLEMICNYQIKESFIRKRVIITCIYKYSGHFHMAA